MYLNKFKRGQVWIIYQNEEEANKKISNTDTHLFEKTRPWLVVQDEDCNLSGDLSGTVTCVPLSTTIRPNDNRAEIVTVPNKSSMAYCDKIKTFNKIDFINAKFIGFLPNEEMVKVDEALAAHLGLKMKYPGLDELEKIIEKIAEAKIKDAKMKNIQIESTSAAIKHITRVLTNTFDKNLPNSEPSSDKDSKLTYHTSDIDNPEQNIVKEIDTSGTVTIKDECEKKNVSKQKNRWTVPKMKRFMNDAEVLSSEELAKKYKIGRNSVYVYKKNFREMLNPLEEANKN